MSKKQQKKGITNFSSALQIKLYSGASIEESGYCIFAAEIIRSNLTLFLLSTLVHCFSLFGCSPSHATIIACISQNAIPTVIIIVKPIILKDLCLY